MKESSAILDSILTCPHCGHQTQARMPIDACQFFFECPHCHTLLKPKPGDCCVFCSHGSVSCPPKQNQPDNACY
ncbi:MAG: GDCCVxC domain-containing (seleno)protein [Gammaproteobacteria bacterium]